MTLYEFKKTMNDNQAIAITDNKWDYLEMFSRNTLKNDEMMKKIKIEKIGMWYDDIKIIIDFTKFIEKNATLFNKYFKELYTIEAQKELKDYKKDNEISKDDVEEWLIFECQVIEYMLSCETF